MSNVNDLLNFFLQHIGEWSCTICGIGSNQTAGTFRSVRNMGYRFEEVAPNRWGQMMFCERCKRKTTHYKLLSPIPEFEEHKRIGIDKRNRARILTLLGGRDAFTGASIACAPEIDHKVPWTRLDEDYNVQEMSDSEIRDTFQLLTREHNLLKDRMCDKCKKTGIRPPFLGISFWYKGDYNYRSSCEGCGWYDGAMWRHAVNDILLKK